MSPVDKRTVPLRRVQGATLLAITLENQEARVSFRCTDGEIAEMAFSRVETVTNRAAEGMVVQGLTEEVMFGGRLPSRFVFESTDVSRTLAITAKASFSPDTGAEGRSWRSRVDSLSPGARLKRPAAGDKLSRVAAEVGVPLPAELAAFLGESDGLQTKSGVPLIWTVAEIIEQNRMFRTNREFAFLYMPFDSLLFFGSIGNGDQCAYRVLAGIVPPTSGVYRWDHESDNREWIARDLEDYLRRKAE